MESYGYDDVTLFLGRLMNKFYYVFNGGYYGMV